MRSSMHSNEASRRYIEYSHTSWTCSCFFVLTSCFTWVVVNPKTLLKKVFVACSLKLVKLRPQLSRPRKCKTEVAVVINEKASIWRIPTDVMHLIVTSYLTLTYSHSFRLRNAVPQASFSVAVVKKVSFSSPHGVLKKLKGSIVCPQKRHPVVSSSMTHSKVSQTTRICPQTTSIWMRVVKKVHWIPGWYKVRVVHWLTPKWSPVFAYTMSMAVLVYWASIVVDS